MIETILKEYVMILLGDSNAKIGKEASFKDLAGIQKLHEITNNNGERL